MVENITIIKGTDGPTAVFLAGKNHRYTLRQKIKIYTDIMGCPHGISWKKRKGMKM